MYLAKSQVGVDVGKKKLDVCCPDGKKLELANTKAGRKKIIRIAKQFEAVVCFESTGGYEDELASDCLAASVPASRLDPWRVRKYAESRGRIEKTDALDCEMIRDYAASLRPEELRLVKPRSEAYCRLVRGNRVRRNLLKIREAYRNLLEHTDDPVWLHRLLELCADIKMSGKKVLVGYSSHQMLPLACVAVDGLAAGRSRITRMFWRGSFVKPEEGDVGFARPKPSYYCPQALTEFSLKYMDLARMEDVLELMRPDAGYTVSPRVDAMLNSPSPLSSDYALRDGYLHYCDMLVQQCAQASVGKSFSERFAWQMRLLDSAEALLNVLHKHRIRGLLKDFSKYIGIARSALQSLEETRGVNLTLNDVVFK